MSIEFKERNVSGILYNLNAFWSSSLMLDRHVIDQAWRGYHNVADNLYTQLYQLHYSKALQTITPNWLSHWERFNFNAANEAETFNALYPYAYKLPENVKSVYLLRESPREISLLPSLTLILNNGQIVTPDGNIRFPGDLVYQNEDLISFDIPCATCDATGVLNGDSCPVCNGTKIASGYTSKSGFGVETVKYYKRADDIADYEEGITPLGDFVVDEVNKIIAFKTQPYATLWSEYVVRDTEIIYDNFGTLLKFYKTDSYRYLRQTQGLWYAYWNGSTINNIEIGLNVISDLPFVLDSGYVQNIAFLENEFITSREVVVANLLTEYTKLPILPTQTASMYDLKITIRAKPEYVLKQGIDYDIIYQYEDAEDYLDWYSYADFNSINAIPAVTKQAYIKFNDTIVTSQISDGDFLDIYFEDGSGSYIITIAGTDYVISDEYVPEVVVNQYLEKFTPLTDAINVYDYKNYPNWWEALLGYTQESTFFRKFGRIFVDSGVVLDSGISLDSFHEYYAKADLFYYHTFLVSLEKAAVPHTLEQVQLIRSFLDTIKPSYSHYIIRATLDFSDECPVREANFAIEFIYNVTSTQGPVQRYDNWTRLSCDNALPLDGLDRYEKLFVAKLPLDGIIFISDIDVHSCRADSLEHRCLDSNRVLDTYLASSSLTITKELP